MRLPPRRPALGLFLATGALLVLVGCEEVSVNVVSAASVEISPDDVTVFEGEEEEVSAIVRSSEGAILTGRSIEWTIDDPAVAGVSETGVVRGEEPGTTTIRVETEGVEANAPVTVLPRPEIGLSRSEVGFQGVSGDGDPPDEEVEVVNEGGGTLSGLSLTVETEGDDADWLSASLGTSVAPTTLTISASIGSRPAGAYEGTVLVSSPEAHNSPQQVQVTLQVEEAPPIIQVVPTSVSFSSVARSFELATQSVTVTNAGGGTLSGLSAAIEYVSGPGGWLTPTLDSSTAPTLLQLEASP
ncbi:MAG: Ig-like domain-containing protein, partial [Gemmatimonadota bacterium]